MLNINTTDLSQLVEMRYKNQSRESAESTRTKGKEDDTNKDSSRFLKPPTERQLLAAKIYEALRLDAEQGSSTGLNRRVRHTTVTGNAANAQAAARTGSAAVCGTIPIFSRDTTHLATIDHQKAKRKICKY